MILASDIPAGDATLVAILGYGVVFLGLIVLMGVVFALGKYFTRRDKKQAATTEVIPEVVPAPAAANEPVAPGAAGTLKLHDVDPKTAAMLMAIVADKLQKPLNELRFTSIREVK